MDGQLIHCRMGGLLVGMPLASLLDLEELNNERRKHSL